MTTMPFPQETPCLRAAFELYRLWDTQRVEFLKPFLQKLGCKSQIKLTHVPEVILGITWTEIVG